MGGRCRACCGHGLTQWKHYRCGGRGGGGGGDWIMPIHTLPHTPPAVTYCRALRTHLYSGLRTWHRHQPGLRPAGTAAVRCTAEPARGTQPNGPATHAGSVPSVLFFNSGSSRSGFASGDGDEERSLCMFRSRFRSLGRFWGDGFDGSNGSIIGVGVSWSFLRTRGASGLEPACDEAAIIGAVGAGAGCAGMNTLSVGYESQSGYHWRS